MHFQGPEPGSSTRIHYEECLRRFPWAPCPGTETAFLRHIARTHVEDRMLRDCTEDPGQGSVTKIFSGPAARGRIPRTQIEDPWRGSITKIFSGLPARGRIPRAQNEDPGRGFTTKIFPGPAARGRSPRFRNEDPVRGTITKISPDYRRLWARTFIDHEYFPRIPETLGEDVHRGAIAQTGERWCGLRTRIQSEDR